MIIIAIQHLIINFVNYMKRIQLKAKYIILFHKRMILKQYLILNRQSIKLQILFKSNKIKTQDNKIQSSKIKMMNRNSAKMNKNLDCLIIQFNKIVQTNFKIKVTKMIKQQTKIKMDNKILIKTKALLNTLKMFKLVTKILDRETSQIKIKSKNLKIKKNLLNSNFKINLIESNKIKYILTTTNSLTI
ncbi:hypothetical protein TTHERM_000216168 (macronuclear) [Tetrahymena thermophila SB210]|uniref:Uncharacterized protein n=1 Tax=Tetrahymena thermophila (strain SB210) TaxID=312017 RepID=W7XIG3_TETTS|nr:hypothetical protein TTHERM_000216168 [Tetrahymena thermophila SB210]EWS73264.1 hypothetical protein TTHERM_000216168 [Tetrahymena thermophila SB210]|eukprot:XP_012654173.1 hypothetical protein TTHERM_000216168 [Tetrahymena thermophila SB210]